MMEIHPVIEAQRLWKESWPLVMIVLGCAMCYAQHLLGKYAPQLLAYVGSKKKDRTLLFAGVMLILLGGMLGIAVTEFRVLWW